MEVIDSLRLFEVPIWKNHSFLHQKYIIEGLSIRQISTLVMSSKEAVRKELLIQKVPLRDKSQHHGHPAQLRYGHRFTQSQLIENKTEQRTIEAIKQMKQEGLSLRAIARCLSQIKVPTKNRGKKWHPEMVRRILEKSLE
jgi:hypothetical protein